MSDPGKIREQFPILRRQINGQPLVYFDNAATTQKPRRVLDAMTAFYSESYSNIHRGVHTLSREATDIYEASRAEIANFFGISNPQRVIFTAGTTDSINLVAQSLADSFLKEGDEILIPTYEHHSNILPWQLWAERNRGKLVEIPLAADQSLQYELIDSLITPRTKLIALAHVSNTLGVITDVARISTMARKRGIAVLIDGAQSAPHLRVSPDALGADFFACSAHKMYGPTGIGVLILSEKWLKELPVSRTGGGTIKTVTFGKTEYAEGALRFEPGTPNIAGAAGFAEAIRFMNETGVATISDHESALTRYAQSQLEAIPEVLMYGNRDAKAAVISFNVKGSHPFDVGTLLDKYGIAVRTGHHCTQPLMKCLGLEGTVRISFAVYNTKSEIDFFIEKLKKVVTMLA